MGDDNITRSESCCDVPSVHLGGPGKNAAEQKRTDDKEPEIFIRSSVPLPKFEIFFYFVLWGTVATLMVVYCALLSWEYEWEFAWGKPLPGLKNGWIERQKQDTTEFEWNFICRIWWPRLLPWVVGHSIISVIAHKLLPEFRSHIWLLYSMGAMTVILGYKPLLLLLFQCFITYAATKTKNPLVVWMVCGGHLGLYDDNIAGKYMRSFFPLELGTQKVDEHHNLLLISSAWSIMRMLSFCLERCNQKDGDHGYGFLDLLAFVFYLPLMYSGPNINYDSFRLQVSAGYQPWTQQEFVKIAKELIRQIFYVIVIEYHLHYFYYASMSHNTSFFSTLSSGDVAVLLYCKVMFFYLKYVSIYGVSSWFASLDRIKMASQPACVSRISTFSEIWKTFDRGFHSFITRYIYIPIGGSKHGIGCQFLATASCFFFIYMWHGTAHNILIWSFINFVGMMVEMIGKKVSNLKTFRKMEARFLSRESSRRVTSLLCVPPMCVSLLGLIYFFDGDAIGNMFWRRLFIEGNWSLYFNTLLVLYCGCNAAFSVWNWDMEKKKQKQA